MSPVVFILLVVGADRLLGAGRPPVLRPVQRWWVSTRPRLIAYVRSAPVTFGYLAVLFVTTWVLTTASGRLADRLLLAASTNLHQLARDPVRVLMSSAFWLPGTGSLLVWAVLLVVVLAPVERRIGSWRLGAVFGIGHVGATLLTAAGLWTALRLDAVEHSVVNARDVGASYGFLAVAGALTFLLVPRLRFAYGALLLVPVVAVATLSHTFTDFGHVLALLLGFGCRPLVRGRSTRLLLDVPALRLRRDAESRASSEPA